MHSLSLVRRDYRAGDILVHAFGDGWEEVKTWGRKNEIDRNGI